jgi:hypothetical protein
MSDINLSASILPGTSAGGYDIGENISSYKELSEALVIDTTQKSIGQILSDSKGWLVKESWSKDKTILGNRKYYYKDNIIRLDFNSSGLLYAIYVSEGYQGKAFEQIGVHSNLADVRKIFNIDYVYEMYYPEKSSGVSGIAFYAVECPTEEFTQDGEILMICVHNWSLEDKD